MTQNYRFFRVMLLLLAGGSAYAQPYWEPLLRRENLAGPLPYERIECFSSHGEGITNDDRGNYLRRDDFNWNILCDLEGPGVLSEFGWTRRGPIPELRFRIFVDDTVAWDMDVRADSICGRTSPFLPPLADSSASWYWNYAPVPFNQRLRITYVGNTMAYHGCAQMYDDGVTLESFRVPVPLSYYLKRDTMETVWSQPSRPAMWNQTVQSVVADTVLLSFRTAEPLSYEGSGVVRKLWMIPQDTTRSYLDRTVVRIYFDHNPEPAIAAQIGLLFNCSEGVTTYSGAVAGRSGDTLYFQPIMPFSTKFRVEVDNNVVNPGTNRIRVGADIVELEPQNVPLYRLGGRSLVNIPTRRYDGFRAAEFYGKGNYLGAYLEMDNTSGQALEGDETLMADGEAVRVGVGTPEYFNASYNWLGPNGQPAMARHFAHGVVTITNNDYSAYRYHFSDAVPFNDSLSLDFEVGGWQHLTGNYRCMSLAYLEPKRFSVRDQDSSRTSTGGEILTIFARGMVDGRMLSGISWNNIPLDLVGGSQVVADSVVTVYARAPFASAGVGALVAQFSDGVETIMSEWAHRATPTLEFRVQRDEIDGYAFAGDTIAITLRGYPEGERANVVFEGLTLPWIGTEPEASEDGVVTGRVTLPSSPADLPEVRARLTAQAVSVEGFPDAVSDEYLTSIRMQRIEIERLTVIGSQGGSVTELCACDYQTPDSLDPWGRMLVKRMQVDTTGEFVKIALPVRASGSYRLNYFFGESRDAGLIRVLIDDVIDLDSVRVFNSLVLPGEWDRSDTVRGNWRYLEADTHLVTFAGDRAHMFQDTVEMVLDQILLESEFHIEIPVSAPERRELPTLATLAPAYPNPFNPSTRLRFTLNTSAHVKLEVFNLLGQSVKTLVDAQMTAGEYESEFSCSDCASGLYLARLSLPNTMMTRKLLLLK